ncbi:helix-turn-helix transcriptional regulator [Peribacillus frigoritolerans]|uniref:helix-turn-helix domain-containing protein n=1 Tax=Peribacillus frigoritolerans TaxID=450367 RepID=UPI00301ABA14
MENEKFQFHGKSMRLLRVNHGMDGAQMAKAIGVVRSYISSCELNQRQLSEEKTKTFLDVLGITEEQAKVFVQIVGY